MISPFGYTCETCLEAVPMTAAQYQRRAPFGRFRCDACLAGIENNPKGTRIRTGEWQRAREGGCIVTVQLPDGSLRSIHRDGRTIAALRWITDRLPEGSIVLSVSTIRSVARDMDTRPRTFNGPGTPVDRYKVERDLLGKIGRLDLLPPHSRGRAVA